MKTRTRSLVALALFMLALGLSLAFAIVLFYGLERQNLLDEITIRRQLSVAASATRNAITNEIRLIERSWGRQFRDLVMDNNAEVPPPEAGRVIESLRADLDEPDLIADWIVFKRPIGPGMPVLSFMDDTFRPVRMPDWLATVIAMDWQATAGSPDRLGMERRPVNRFPVLFPEAGSGTPRLNSFEAVILLDAALLRDRIIPALADRFFPRHENAGPTSVTVFEYRGAFPPEAHAADLVFPLLLVPGLPETADPDTALWASGDIGVIIRYGDAGIKALVQLKSRRNLGICLLLFASLSIGISLTYIAERRFMRSMKREREFIALFSHELKTPLSVIRSTAENLVAGLYTGQTEIQARARTIVAADQRLAALVDTILSIASGEARRGTRLDLVAVASSAVERTQAFAAERQALVDFVPPGKTCPVIADEGALSGVIDALIVNAIIHGAPLQGEHKVRVQVFLKERRDLPVWGRMRIAACLVVSDRGRGVPRGEIRRARSGRIGKTDRDQDRNGSGTAGLGLPLVLKTVKAHGGRVLFERWPGACVIVMLPAVIP
jgi:signal transduction histidine kinase